MTTIVGITGYAGAGKDTAAAALSEQLGYTRIALADPIKKAITKLNPILDSSMFTVQQALFRRDWSGAEGSPSWWQAWDQLKREVPEARRLLQVFGTEVGRDMFGQNVWIDYMLRKAADHALVVVPDVRFRNEAEAIIVAGGIVVGIDRPGVGALNSHSSEAGGAIDLASLWIPNDDTQRGFEALVVSALRDYTSAALASPVWPAGKLPGTPCKALLCPDCRVGKHGNCDSTSWCTQHDHTAGCPCDDISH